MTMDVPSQALEAAATEIARALCDQEERAEAEGETAWYGLGTDYIAELTAAAALAAIWPVVEAHLRTTIAAEIEAAMLADRAWREANWKPGRCDVDGWECHMSAAFFGFDSARRIVLAADSAAAVVVHPVPLKGSNE